MGDIILKTTDLTKKYNNKTVVDNLNIEIRKGEIFGLLGPNGAGKSTTMNMICSLIRPTAGEIDMMGKNPWKQKKEVIHKIGYIPQELAIHGNLKAWENVELFTSLYGIKGQELKKAINDSLEYVGLLERKQEFAKNFSGGMKRRLNIACALGHNPELLIFDEPTVGIDPQSRNFILDKIKESNAKGTTVIYTKGYLIKNHTPEHLKQMIKSVYNGTGVMEDTILENLAKNTDIKSNGFCEEGYTAREMDIIKAVADGLSNKEIASKFLITEGTVKNYITSILAKENLSHRTALAVYYLTGKKQS